MKHATPRPWRRTENPDKRNIDIWTPGTPKIATVHLRHASVNEWKDNADLIVRSVNSHDELLNALRLLQGWATDLMGPEGTQIPDGHPIQVARLAIQNAMEDAT